MAVFIGTYENRVDRKGRISVPAPFRQALAGQPVQAIVCHRSFHAPAINGYGLEFLERIVDSLSDVELFSDEQDNLATAIFADCQQLGIDGEGRVILPRAFCEHALIEERAAFVGKGRHFEIWEPGSLARKMDAARRQVKEQGLTLKLRWQLAASRSARE